MIVNIAIGVLIFTYSAWTVYRFIQKSKKGKCSGCSEEQKCSLDSCEDKK